MICSRRAVLHMFGSYIIFNAFVCLCIVVD
jgi:hypothetical protein